MCILLFFISVENEACFSLRGRTQCFHSEHTSYHPHLAIQITFFPIGKHLYLQYTLQTTHYSIMHSVISTI